MRRLGIGLLILVGVLAVGWWVLPRLVSKDMLRGRLEASLSGHLGRSVEIGDVGFGLRPLPSVRATDIRLGRTGSAEGDQEISAESLDLALALRPLFRREFEVVRANVDGLVVDIYLPGATDSALPAAGTDHARAREETLDPEARGDDAESGGAGSGSDPSRRVGGIDGDADGRSPRADEVGDRSGVTVRIESLVLTAATVRVHRGEAEVLLLDQIDEDLRADVAADGVIRYSGRTEIPTWRLTTPTGAFGHGLPLVLEKSLRYDPAEGTLRVESALLDVAGLPVSLEGTVSGLGAEDRAPAGSTDSGGDDGLGTSRADRAGADAGVTSGATAGPVLDLRFTGGPGRIESIVGLLPSAWVTRAEGLRSSGEVEVRGNVQGPVGPGVEPDFLLDLTIRDGRLEGGDLPSAIESLNAALRVDPRSIVVESLSARSSGSNLEARGRIDDYRDVPRLDLAMEGDLDLGLVTALTERTADANPIGTPTPELSGRAEFQAVVTGTMPPGRDPGETLVPVGTVTVRDVDVRGIERPIEGLSGVGAVRGKALEVSEVTFRIGESDLRVDGRVEDFWALDPRGFDQPGSTRSDLVVRSRLLDLDALAPPTSDGSGTAARRDESGAADRGSAGARDGAAGGSASGGAGAAPTGFEVFAGYLSRLDGPIDLTVETLRARKLEWTNVRGRGALERGQVRIDALDLGIFGGTIASTGRVDLRDPRNPHFDLDLGANQLEAARFFTDNPGLSRLSGLGGFVEGAIDLTAEAKGSFDEAFQLDLKTLTSLGSLEMEGGRISGHPIQAALAAYLGQADLQRLPIHDWLQPFRVREGRVEFENVLITAGDFTFNASGWTSIDGQIGLDADLLVPAGRTAGLRAKLPKLAADVLLGSADAPVLLPISVRGSAASPSIGIDDARLTDRARARAVERLDEEKRTLQEALQAEKDALQRKLEEEARQRTRDAIGGLLPGRSAADSSGAASADSSAGKLEEEVKGLLKGLFGK